MADSSGEIQAKIRLSLKRAAYPVTLLFLWLSILSFPSRVAGVNLDESWQRSLGYFLKHRLQAGTDYIYTYGPLGYFNTTIYDRDLFWAAYFFQIIVRGFFVYYLASLIKQETKPFFRFLSIFLLILFLGIVHRDAEALFFLVIIGINLADENSSWIQRTISLALLSIFALGKFTIFGFSVFIVVCSEFLYRAKRAKAILSPLSFFLIIFFALYLVLGQSLSDFPVFLYGSIQVSSGYNTAMSISGNPYEMYLSLAVFLLLLFLLLQIHQQQKTRREESIKLLILVAGLFLAWKQGFLRQDNHTSIFFGFSMFVALTLILHFQFAKPRSHSAFVIVASCCALLGSILGFLGVPLSSRALAPSEIKHLVENSGRRIRNNSRILLSPIRTKYRLEGQEEALEQTWKLPILSSRIRNATVDIWSFQQAILLLNHFHWLPRPAFQGHMAFTPYLSKKNAQFFHRETAPDFLLFKLQTIDDRFPSLDDGPALLEVLSRYTPEAVERSFLLLKKQPKAQNVKLTTYKNQMIRFNEEFSVPRRFPYQILHLDIRPTLMGKLRNFFFRPPHVFVTVKTLSKRTFTYRLIPGPAIDGFLISPFIRTTSDFTRLFAQPPGNGVHSFTLRTENPGVWFQDAILMELRGADDLINRKMDMEKLAMIRDALQSDASFDGKQRITRLNLRGGEPYEDDYLAMYRNGSFVTEPRVLPPGRYKMILVGYGTKAGQEFPAMNLVINKKKIEEFYLDKRPHEFVFTTAGNEPVQVSLEFHNDAVIGNEDRNVFLKSLYVVPWPEK